MITCNPAWNGFRAEQKCYLCLRTCVTYVSGLYTLGGLGRGLVSSRPSYATPPRPFYHRGKGDI